jgi:F-type H+-transporting ATPase subunit epsilon
MKAFHIEIVTPDGLKYSGEVESLLVRTTDGDVEILAGHTDFLASLATGVARLIIDGKSRRASTSGGFLSIKGGKVRLCAVTFEFAEDIDLKRAEDAKARAEAALSTARDERDERIARAKLMRAASRIKVASTK